MRSPYDFPATAPGIATLPVHGPMNFGGKLHDLMADRVSRNARSIHDPTMQKSRLAIDLHVRLMWREMWTYTAPAFAMGSGRLAKG